MSTTPVVLTHTAPPVEVAAPARQPGRFGLFSVANIVPAPEMRFENGVEYDPVPCGPATGVSGACVDVGTVVIGVDDYGDPVRLGPNIDTVTGLPFAVYGWYDCSAFGRSLSESTARAREHLAAGEERAVELAVARGDLDNAPSFAGATDLTPAGGAHVIEAIGILESHLGSEYGGVGVIHVPRRAVARLGERVSRQGQHLETTLGNYVAAGGGYDVAQAADLADEEATFYATSVPTIRRSDVFTTPDPDQALNRNTNNVTAVAQRVYVVAWECVTVAVTVDLGPELT